MSDKGAGKFTPGPWRVQGNRDDDAQELVIIQDAVMDAEIATIYPTLGYAEADIANAKLIAAAPELLEALEKVMQGDFRHAPHTRTGTGGVTEHNPKNCTLCIVETAIKKAKGESA